jgi:hypothetical protein
MDFVERSELWVWVVPMGDDVMVLMLTRETRTGHAQVDVSLPLVRASRRAASKWQQKAAAVVEGISDGSLRETRGQQRGGHANDAPSRLREA